MYVKIADDGIPHFPKVTFVFEFSEEVLYSGNMLITQSAPVWVLKIVLRLNWLIFQY
jgi:hypothetical protein